MTMTAWYGESNAKMGRQFDSLARAMNFLKKKKAKLKYVEIDGYEKVGRISVATFVRIDI
ncbi:MAG: hypothetical protein HYU39_03205 [Thaumarchaeota archaeon]|nr:hypothetical protein [Nitrososphaerota archaeon]